MNFRPWSADARRKLFATFIVLVGLLLCGGLFAGDSSPQVTLNISPSRPRPVEPLTQRAIVRDYRFAWASLDRAFESNSAGPLDGLFAGTANDWLNDAVNHQRRSGITSAYRNQRHKVDAVFYAPAGDVIELHDTSEYDFQIRDGSKTIHQEHAMVRYVVLMTPAADRWVIRQLEAVPGF